MQKKILFVATVASHIKAFHLPYLKMMRDRGYKTYVAANWNLQQDEKLDYCDKFLQLSIQRSPYSIQNLNAIKKLKKIINEEKFDIIHCHTPMGAVITRLASKKARKKYGTRVIYTAHGFHFYNGTPKKNWLLFYPVEKALAKFTDVLITINKEDYQLAKTKFFKKCKNIIYVPGVGIDVKKFEKKLSKNEEQLLKKSLNIKADDYILLCVARLDNNKNQGFLIKVMQQLTQTIPNIHLLLAGRDELNHFYQDMVNEYRLTDRVHFLGNRDDIPELLSISNVVLSASKREGLPVNVLEAFAAGKPFVALRGRGTEDLITNGENGYVVEFNDYNQFAECILKLYNNKKISKQMGENNLKKIKNYDIEVIKKEMLNIYNMR